MNITNVPLNEILTSGIVSTLLFLVLLLISKKSNTPVGYRLLAFLFFLLIFVFADDALESRNLYNQTPFLKVICQPILFAFPPFIYLSVRYLTHINKKLSVSLLLHGLPYLLLLSMYLIEYDHTNQTINQEQQGTKPVAATQAVSIQKPRAYTVPKQTSNETALEKTLLTLFFSQTGIYLVLAWRQLKSHRKTLPLFASDLAAYDFHWLQRVILGLALLVIISFAEVVLGPPFLTYQTHLGYFYSFFYLIGFYYIGVQVSRQTEVFPFSHWQRIALSELIDSHAQSDPDATTASTKEGNRTLSDTKEIAFPTVSSTTNFLNQSHQENPYQEKPSDDPADQEPSYSENLEEAVKSTQVPSNRKTILATDKIEECKNQLLMLMQQQRSYLDSQISLPSLSQMLGLTTYQTSYLINHCFNENFYTFINRYRLEACKQMLLDSKYDHLSILGIGFEAGFNSKTAFNTFFKKNTGLSPKEYKEQHTKNKALFTETGSDLSTT